jgi:hypothetical protein
MDSKSIIQSIEAERLSILSFISNLILAVGKWILDVGKAPSKA